MALAEAIDNSCEVFFLFIIYCLIPNQLELIGVPLSAVGFHMDASPILQMQLLLKRGRKKPVLYLGTWRWICVLVIEIFIWQMQPMLDFQLAAFVLGQEKILMHFNLFTAQLGNIWDVLHTETHRGLEIFYWELILVSG